MVTNAPSSRNFLSTEDSGWIINYCALQSNAKRRSFIELSLITFQNFFATSEFIVEKSIYKCRSVAIRLLEVLFQLIVFLLQHTCGEKLSFWKFEEYAATFYFRRYHDDDKQKF